MARVPVDLVRRGIDMGAAPSRYKATQHCLFEMRRRLHLRLRDMTEDDLRQVNMCTFESMMMQLWREGHTWTGRILTELVELDKIARKICMLVAPELRRGPLKKEKKLLRLLADELCSAEDAMNVGDNAVKCRHLLNLAAESAAGGVSWWWLTERLLKEATAAVAGARDDGETAAQVAFATGVFLLDQLHESGEAVAALTYAMRLSQKGQWLANARLMMAEKKLTENTILFPTAPTTKPETEELGEPAELRPKTPPDCGTEENPVTLFECASAVLCRALIQEGRRARIGCPFGVDSEKGQAHARTEAKTPTSVTFNGNPFQNQVDNVDLRTPRVFAERTPSGTTTLKTNKPKLDFVAILKDDNSEPEVQDPSKVDSDSAANFCREAAQHAQNAGRRDYEECALMELGISLRSGGKYQEALRPLKTVLQMYKDSNNSGQETKTNFQIALCYQKMEKYQEAHQELQNALVRAQETSNHALIYAAHKYLGMFFLNTSQRQYASTHLALALLQVNNFNPGNYQRCLIRVLVGLAGANELMPEFISLLRSTESPGQEGWRSMLKLLEWKEKRTPFWPEDRKISQAVKTLEMSPPPRPAGETVATEESRAEHKRNLRKSIDKAEPGDTSQGTKDDGNRSGTSQMQSDENKYVLTENDADTLADTQTEVGDDLPTEGEP